MTRTDRFDWQRLSPPGVARTFTPPAQPLWRFLEAAAAERPDGVAIAWHDGARDPAHITFAALWRGALAWGARLRAAGLAPGGDGDAARSACTTGTVQILLPNCPEFAAVFHGALAAGLVVTAASPHLTAPETVPLTEDALAGAIVTTENLRPVAEAVADAVAARTGRPRIAILTVRPGEDFAPAGPAITPVQSDPDAVAVLQYTSGTTGGVKAAMMTHRNLVANALQNNAWFGWTADDVILGALPICHTWGMCCVLNAALAAKARIALIPEFRESAVFDVIRAERVSVAYGSATMFHRLLDAAGAEAPSRFASLRYVKAGAMLVGSDLFARWTAAVPAVPMVNGYGLTEASPEVTNNPPHARRAGTVGIPLPGTEIRLCAPDAPDREVGLGEEGEVQVRGPQVMKGYWRRPDATAAALLADGWLRTGDLAAFDDAGYLVIRDRLKDLIKFRGWSVIPGEVEKALREHSAVSEACVVGAPDPRDGEVPVAFLVLRPGSDTPGDDAWRAHLEPRLSRMKQPRRFVVVSEIPKNHVGKPLRRVLRDSLRA